MTERHILVVEEHAIAVNLVLQGEIENDIIHLLLVEDFGTGGVLLFLKVLNHVREPHSQTIVAGIGERKGESSYYKVNKFSNNAGKFSQKEMSRILYNYNDTLQVCCH